MSESDMAIIKPEVSIIFFLYSLYLDFVVINHHLLQKTYASYLMAQLMFSEG